MELRWRALPAGSAINGVELEAIGFSKWWVVRQTLKNRRETGQSAEKDVEIKDIGQYN